MKHIILLITLITMMSCGAGKDGKPGESGKPGAGANYIILSQGDQGGGMYESFVFVDNEADFINLLQDMHIENVPAVDFKEKIAVIISMGQKTTGGYSITVESVDIKKSKIKIVTKKTSPTGMATMAMTNPYCIVEVPKGEKVEVKF